VADRCLACGNCTSVCPTCFCSTTEEESDLAGSEGAHVRLWDSCFTQDHATIHGGSYRPTVKDRYRQWLTHKVGAWVSQYGTSGCVGCGRCIAWCPVGIDITEEVAALREGEGEAPMPDPPRYDEHEEEDVTPRPAEVVAVSRETHDVATLHLKVDGLEGFLPGQFCQLSLPAIGEAPISISGTDGSSIEHTIRAVGAVTEALCALEPGQELGLRGPYGQPWPLEEMAGAPVAVVAGGIGLAPLREALRRMLGRPDDFPEVHLFYGARSPDDAVFVREMLGWLEEPTFRLHMTVDHATPSWRGHVGVVTRLLAQDLVPEGTRAMICGPEVMMGFTVQALEELGVPDERIYVTMERHMKCATGFCGRCQYGPWFVCKDGPVFRYDQIRMLFGKEGY
jgi:NAD(P)H-flavin reductase/formate hydrogenlyase subunit 6/NADH:ubiquinone oxidoreductase subunit I